MSLFCSDGLGLAFNQFVQTLITNSELAQLQTMAEYTTKNRHKN